MQLLGHLAEAGAPGVGTWDTQVTIVAWQPDLTCGKDDLWPSLDQHFEFQALGPDLCKQFVGVQLEAFCEDLPGIRGICGCARLRSFFEHISDILGEIILPLATDLGTSTLEMRDGSTGGDMAPPEKQT